MAKYEEHKFYCLKCGKAGIPLRRNAGFQHGALHRKKLYCPHCKETLNHIEIKTPDQERQFKEDFKNGVYINEAEASCDFVRTSW